MASEFVHRRRVEFAETDMAGIMHFTNYFRFMESAEHAFFRSLGFSVARPDGDGRLGLPRVHARCDFLAPLRFEDEVEIRLRVARKSRRSLTYHFTLRRVQPAPEVEAARGEITVVCVEHRADGTLKAVPLPEAIARALEAAPATGRTRPAAASLKKSR
jgi:YbgC/YbaW family acyl-CoA thioester hydrolase